MPITWTRTNQVKATIAGLAAAVAIWLAFESYLAPLAIAITTLYVAWNRNNTVTMREWRLLATVIAGSVTLLGIPTLQERFPHNYTLVALVIVASIAAFWIPAVWRLIGGGPKPPQPAKKEGKTTPGRAILVAAMLILILVPTASAYSPRPCPYPEPAPGTIQTMDWIFPQPGEEGCSQSQLHNKGAGKGIIDSGKESGRLPLCKDLKRFAMQNQNVKINKYNVEATAAGNDLDLDISFNHRFTGTTCLTSKAVNSVLKPVARKGEVTCKALAEECGWEVAQDSAPCLTHWGPGGCGWEGGAKQECWIPEGCGNTAIKPTGFVVRIDANSGNKRIMLYKEQFENLEAFDGQTVLVYGADGKSEKQEFSTTIENVGAAFAAAKVKMPKTIYVTATVTYAYDVPECPNSPITKMMVNGVGKGCSMAVKKAVGIATTHVKVPSKVCSDKALTCNGGNSFTNWLGNSLHRTVDGKIPGVNPGVTVGNLAPKDKCSTKTSAATLDCLAK